MARRGTDYPSDPYKSQRREPLVISQYCEASERTRHDQDRVEERNPVQRDQRLFVRR
jgi:hypothetical protein